MTVDERFTDDYMARRQDTALLGKRNAIVTGPVEDWATDFSHLEPEWAADPYPILDDLRERCPIAHTDRFGGGWLPTRYEDVAAVAYDTENFTSRSIIMSNFRPPKEIEPVGTAPPISRSSSRRRGSSATRSSTRSRARTWSTPRMITRSTSRCV